MPKRISSTNGWLTRALDYARKGEIGEAQRALAKVARRTMAPDELRIAAQVQRRCEFLEQAEACWRQIEQRDAMEPGDYYMLGSVLEQRSKSEAAAQAFEREIAIAASTGTVYYLDAARIRLADLMLKLGRSARAKEVLAEVEDSSSDYIEGVGVRTKAAILRDIETSRS